MPRQTPQAGAFGQRRSQAGNLSTYVAPTQARDAGAELAQIAKGFSGLSNTINQMGVQEGREADEQMRALAPKIAEMREEGLSDDEISTELSGLTTRRAKKRIRKSLDKDGTLNNIEDPMFNMRLAETQGIERGSMWLEEQEEFLTDAMTTAFESAGLDGMSEDERLKEVLSNPSLTATVADHLADLTPLARLEAEKQIEDGLRVLAARGKEKAKVTRENTLSNGEARFATNGTTILGEPGTDPSAVARSIAERISTNSVDLDNETGQKVIGQTVESIIQDLDRQVEVGDLTGAQAAYFIEELQGSLGKKGGGSVLDQYKDISQRLESARFLLSDGIDQSKKDEKKAQAISATRSFVEISLMEDLAEQEAAYGQMENALRAAIDGTLTDEQSERLRSINVDPDNLNDIRVAQATVEAQRQRDRSMDSSERKRGLDNRKADEDRFMRTITGRLTSGDLTRVEAIKLAETSENYAAADRLRNIGDQELRRNQEMIRIVNQGLSPNADGLTALDMIQANSQQVYQEILFSTDMTPEEIRDRVTTYSKLGSDTEVIRSGDDVSYEVARPVPGSGVEWYEANSVPIRQAASVASDEEMVAEVTEIAKVGVTVEDSVVSIDPEAHLIMAERALFSGRLKTTDDMVSGVTIDSGGESVPVAVELLPAYKSMGWGELLQLRFSDIEESGINPGAFQRLFNTPTARMSGWGFIGSALGDEHLTQTRNLKSAYRRYSKTPLSATQLDELVASYVLQLQD